MKFTRSCLLASLLAITMGGVAFAAPDDAKTNRDNATAQVAKANDLELTKDKDNVVSSRLSGSWIIDDALNLRLTGNPAVKGSDKWHKVTFVGDDAVFDQLTDKHKETALKEKITVYMSGWMTFGEQKCPFFLVDRKGNPYILFFLKKGEDVFGNGESINVMMAVAKDTTNDLLFIGGDSNDQPFSAYHRFTESKK